MQLDNDEEGLRKISHHNLTHGNAFDEADFGQYTNRGINHAAKADIMTNAVNVITRYESCEIAGTKVMIGLRRAMLRAVAFIVSKRELKDKENKNKEDNKDKEKKEGKRVFQKRLRM